MLVRCFFFIDEFGLETTILQHAAMILLRHQCLVILGLFLLSFRGCAWFNGKYVAFDHDTFKQLHQ